MRNLLVNQSLSLRSVMIHPSIIPCLNPLKLRRNCLLAWSVVLAFAFSIRPCGHTQVSTGIVGTVSDALGQPVNNTLVRLFSPQRVVEANTDARGQFEMNNLPPGKYELEASSAGFKTKKIDTIEISGDKKELSITLDVRNGGDCGDWDKISYERALGTEGSTLTGAVTDDPRQPLAGVKTELMVSDMTSSIGSQVSNGSGQFRFENLKPGRYRLRVTRQGYHDGETRSFWVTRESRTVVNLQVIKRGLIRICQ